MTQAEGIPVNEAEVARRFDQLVELARAAGRVTLEYFQRDNFTVERKSDNSPVTVADRAAEQWLRTAIKSRFPKDAVLGEEFGELPGDSGFRWILDPIDGTKSFIGGVPLYSTLIGVEWSGRCVLGVIYVPALDEIIYARRGHGAWHQRCQAAPVVARVSQRDNLRDGIFVTSQVDNFDQRGAGEAFRQIQAASYVTRTWGDAYGYLLVATGRAEVMVDPKMNVWDCAALQPIMEEAGGTFTDWQGVSTIYGGEAIATNGLVLPQVLKITRQFPAAATS
jgi:histidinol phosphatase-like enzyme (inositol monophosphatase family)